MKTRLTIFGSIVGIFLSVLAPPRIAAQVHEVYSLANTLENEVEDFVRNGQTDEAAAAILEKLPLLTSAWLDPRRMSLLETSFQKLRKAISGDGKLLPRLKKEIESLQVSGKHDDGEIAAMFDMVGATDEAGAVYARILATDPDPPAAIRHRQIRIIGAKDPAGISKILKDLPDSHATVASLSRIIYDADSYETCIALIETLADFLEKLPADSPRTFHWIPRMEAAFGTIVYGDIQMPPIWKPDRPRDPGYKGRAASREVVDLRQRAYERYCRAAAAIPRQAAWGFSRVAAMADLRGEFEERDELIELARKVTAIAEQPTPYGIFSNKAETPRFVSPELYLARRAWKENGPRRDDLSQEASRRLELLSCEPDAFIRAAKDLIRDGGLGEVIHVGEAGVLRESEPEIATRRLGEVIQIWSARGADVDLLDWILDLELEFQGKRFAHSQGEDVDNLVSYLLAIGGNFGATRVRDVLEQLAYVYVGRPENRAAAIATLPSRNTHIDYFKAPPVVKYVDLLTKMTSHASLAFPAVEMSSELGVDDRVNLYSWLKRDHFASDPALVIERLRDSPFIGDLPRFRTIPVESSEAIRSLARSEPTLLDWVVAEIGKLKSGEQVPYREFFAAEKTFGADLTLAALDSDQGKALQKVLESRLPEIRNLPSRRIQEIAIFAHPRLPKGKSDLRSLLESRLEGANPERLKSLEEAFLKDQWGAGERNVSGILSGILKSDPDLAFQALHRIVDLSPQHFAKHEHDRNEYAPRNRSILTELLKQVFWTWKDDERAKYEFYLRVANDEKLSAHLIIDDQPFGFKPSASNTVSDYLDHFVEEVVWASEALPEPMSSAYLLPVVMRRYGWLNNPAIEAAKAPDFRERIINAVSAKHRDIVRIGTALGSRRHDWVYGDPATPGWKNAEVAAAFSEVGKLVRDPSLSLPFRIFLAGLISGDCQWHTPQEQSLQFAGILAGAWEKGALVGSGQEEKILQFFLYSEKDAEWKEMARRLILAWQQRVEKVEAAGPDAVNWLNRETIAWLIGISAALGDDATQTRFVERLTGLRNSRLPLPTTLLVRAGKTEVAAELFARKDESFAGDNPYVRYTKFDAAIAENLPDFLERIPDPGERFLAEIHLKVLQNNSLDAGLSTREERLVEMARRYGEIEFGRPAASLTALRLLANEPAASAIVAEEFVEVARLDDVVAVHDSNRVYAWRRLAQEMIVALLRAEKFDRALGVLQQISAVTKLESHQFGSTWDALSDAVTTGVSIHQKNPENLEKLLPLTRYMAALPPGHFYQDRQNRTRAGNYARNIFCHARLDRMKEWQAWRQSLDPELREHLDELWYPQSGWAIGLPNTRTPDDAPLEYRLALMQRILSLPEIIGKKGALHSGAIKRLARAEFFSTAELLEHGDELAEAIPDGGQAWRDLAEIAEKAGRADKAGEFLKRAPEEK